MPCTFIYTIFCKIELFLSEHFCCRCKRKELKCLHFRVNSSPTQMQFMCSPASCFTRCENFSSLALLSRPSPSLTIHMYVLSLLPCNVLQRVKSRKCICYYIPLFPVSPVGCSQQVSSCHISLHPTERAEGPKYKKQKCARWSNNCER